jgi:hypothetical protein
MTISGKEKVRLANLAHKNIFLLSFLTIVFTPIVGYAYTGRYLQLIVSFVAFFITLSFSINYELYSFVTYSLIGWYLLSSIENSLAVSNARDKLVNESFEGSSENPIYFGKKSNENIQIQLLKLMRQKRGVTLADCVIETGMNSQKIKPVLEQMVKDDLITVNNRTEDGTIIYRSL